MAKFKEFLKQNLIFLGCLALGIAVLLWMILTNAGGGLAGAFVVFFIYRGIYGIYVNCRRPAAEE